MPSMPPIPPAGIAGSSSGSSATKASVVNTSEAIDVAFCTVDLVTFAVSMTHSLTRSVVSPVAALSPTLPFSDLTFSTITPP